MKTKLLIIFIILSSLITGSSLLSNKIFAQELVDPSNIQYPIAELGNCENEADCKTYCDKPENATSCLDFAEKNNLMSPEEIEVAKKFLAAGDDRPGGCTSIESCEEYCNSIDNINECISFAEENGLIPPEELEEAKKVQAAIARGVKPPPCGNKKACDIYCDNPDHMEECITFAEAAGFIQGQELEDAKKMLAAVKRGVTPPPCRGKEACDEYCSNPDNMELCMNFAIEAGFMSEEEKADAQKMLEAIKKGVMPPNCQGKEECDVYCSQEEHFEECITFAEAAGFMSAEDAAMARKTGGKGPGGCKGEEECRAFCDNPNNQETCFNFAKEHGLISEEDLRKMEEGRQELQQVLAQAPQEVIDCLKSLLGDEMVEKMKAGTAMPSMEMGEKMSECFGQMGPPPEGEPGMMPGAPGEGGMMPPAGQTGPGGCQTAEECQNYCQSNPEECANFQPPTEGPSYIPQEMPTGPGGCQSPEECQSYCQNNPEACQGFGPQPGETTPPTGEFQPPQYQQPPEGTYPPPEGTYPLPPSEGQPGIQPPPSEQQPPSSEPSSLLKPDFLMSSVIYFLFRLFSR